MSFGSLLRASRNECGLTLEDVAISVGLSVPCLSRIERDAENPPPDPIISQLAELIGIQAASLLAEARLPPPDPHEHPHHRFAAYRRMGGGR